MVTSMVSDGGQSGGLDARLEREPDPAAHAASNDAPSGPAASHKGRRHYAIALRITGFLLVVALTVFMYSIREDAQGLPMLGYPGAFLVALLANATILLPAPGLAMVAGFGSVLNPLGVGATAAAGGAIGELTGYLAGLSGHPVITRTDLFNRIRPWIDKHGGWTLACLSAIPNPFFDIAGIAAGMSKMPVRTFLFYTWIGQLVKMTALALAGHYSVGWLAKFLG